MRLLSDSGDGFAEGYAVDGDVEDYAPHQVSQKKNAPTLILHRFPDCR